MCRVFARRRRCTTGRHILAASVPPCMSLSLYRLLWACPPALLLLLIALPMSTCLCSGISCPRGIGAIFSVWSRRSA